MNGKAGQGGKKRGFTLVEVLVATLVLGVAVLGFVGAQIAGLRQAEASREAQKVLKALENQIEAFRTSPALIPSACAGSITLRGVTGTCRAEPCVAKTDGTLACSEGQEQAPLYKVTLEAMGRAVGALIALP